METRSTAAHHRRTRTGARHVVRRAGERAALTDIGLRRAVNQDALFAGDRLLAVADGVGGGPGGEVAARVAIDALAGRAATASSPGDLNALAAGASAAVHDRAAADSSLRGMATTLTAGLFVPDGLAVVHAGDSRLYRLRDGGIEQLTADHAFVEQLVANGLLAPELAATHPMRNTLTRALGRDRDTDFDAFVVGIDPGDVFLFCTDGLTKMVDDRAIARVVATAGSLDDAALSLVRLANAAGGRDNVTVVLAAAPPRARELVDDAATAAV